MINQMTHSPLLRLTFTWDYFILLKVLTFEPMDEVFGCGRSNQTSSIFISHMVLYIKLMKVLTFEHLDGIQGFAGKRVLFLPVVFSRVKN